ncbi:DNA topoisomerase-1 [Carboxydocella sporoproducens DSM 16521]|uniref:DNA topoisomerase 1 n=2 Tax=Carboxydocella TaxID=178898 RepID=A0A1T4RJ32_9FIRM|nr:MULTISPECIES: type I DNA topoisomerase [Carboxydocella]AVX20783.1 DNA topoisomerase-1 [Carboxydocella thermautotrophica]AVX31202.1 DNA topoisomerase-1 [Carboxydocella thermautotrophica]SKA16010.1 DNA topoisomerase-1 [Carboxydocella sporoproducens DSM 16521]
MAKTLVIVESPAKAKTINKFLGRGFKVAASMGHVRDLPKSQLGIDVEKDFAPKYIAIRGKGDLIKSLKAESKKVDQVLLATDPDREGEAIAWHLANLLELPPEARCRIEFNEITKAAIQKAVKQPRQLDWHRIDAQQARRVLDRLVGYSLSPFLWKKIKKGLSAGRVQSVAVRLICDREEEIREFVQEEYWSLEAIFTEPGQTHKLVGKLVQIGDQKAEIKNREEMEKILADLASIQQVQVTAVKKKARLRQPPAPFTTSTLQQEASKRLNFSTRKTMQLAQQLYEGIELGKEGAVGLVTYIRTDSVRIAEEAQREAADYIKTEFGNAYLPEKPRQFASKGKIQNAHEAIRPTSMSRSPENIKQFLTRDQYRLYKLIWDRFLASQMAPAQLETTSIDVDISPYLFRITGTVVIFPGFMKIYQDEEKEEEKQIPPVFEGQWLELRELKPEQHFTQPPPRYTEASLVKTLEELGIGRPSTYAPTIETIQKRGYVTREQKHFYPTELGQMVVELLKQFFPDIIDVEFTAKMEEDLDKIEEGEKRWVDVVRSFYEPFREELQQAEIKAEKIVVADPVVEEKCPNCQANLVIKTGRFGKFLACPNFPECRFTKPLLEETGVLCPQCGGMLVKRRSKKGRTFFGCVNYPECDFTVWNEPVPEKCPQCSALMVRKSKKIAECIKCKTKAQVS